ncbi:MAG TPA: DUF6599 family protein [Bryobacteraceae bacterium]|nr:DUF6599 family protein [Bryobacteraceae bacterium]
MKFLLSAILLPTLAAAAILPDAVGPFQRGQTSKTALSDQPIWKEYGLKSSETATYQNGSRKFTAAVWQLTDTTGSMAAFEWQRPASATPSTAAKQAAETPDSLLLVHGNYLLSFAGYKPSKEELDALTGSLKNVDATVLPVLPSYLPSDGLVPNSERYIMGPDSLQKFAPGISPSLAAFHFGAEAQMGVFHNAKGDSPMLIFNYPTPQIAMQRVTEFQKLNGAVAKRSGPMVAVVLEPADPDYAERLLSGVRYQAQITVDEYVPTRKDNIGDLVINAFILIGILLAFAVVSGLALGGLRALRRHSRHGEEADAMITLHLERP